jgi:hypothetical protein
MRGQVEPEPEPEPDRLRQQVYRTAQVQRHRQSGSLRSSGNFLLLLLLFILFLDF